jgi:hypothetical protein
MLEAYRLFRDCSGASLNSTKCVVGPAFSQNIPIASQGETDFAAIFPGFSVAWLTNFLGTLIGPLAHTDPWSYLLFGYVQAVRAIHNYGLGTFRASGFATVWLSLSFTSICSFTSQIKSS